LKILFLFLLMAMLRAPALVWEDFHPPQYPRAALIAHIEGLVTIQFSLDTDGTVTIKNSSGPRILVAAAEESVKASKLRCDSCGTAAASFGVVFDFEIARHSCNDPEINFPPTAKLETLNRVSVTAEPVCTKDPVVRTEKVQKKVRSIRCLYLWRCGLRTISTSQSENWFFPS